MSAHRTLNDLFRAFDTVGPGRLNDPGDAGTITVGMWGQICSLTSGASAETRTLTQATKPGVMCAVALDTDGGGNVTLTVTGGYNSDADTTLVLADAGDYAVFYSIEVGTSFYWRLIAQEGTSSSVFWADLPERGDPLYHTLVHEWFDDFTKLDLTATVGGWAAFVVGTGTTALANTVAGGQLVMTCQATTDDAAEQIIGVSAPFMLAAGKTIWYETRVKQTGDVQSEVSFGLASLGEDLTAVADVYPEDGISFAHQDASMALALTVSKGGVNTGAVAGVHTMVTATWATYGLLIDGVTSVTPYINGVAGTAATATIPDDTSLAPYFLVRNGDATTAQILTVDYVKACQLR